MSKIVILVKIILSSHTIYAHIQLSVQLMSYQAMVLPTGPSRETKIKMRKICACIQIISHIRRYIILTEGLTY